MTVKHIFLQTCQLIVLLKQVQAYVLFAANLDDFRSMAKKFIPDHLADQISDMASQQHIYKQKSKHTSQVSNHELDEYIHKINSNIGKVVKPLDRQDTPKKKHAVKYNDKAIDFEELVDKVRQKIQTGSVNKHDSKRDRYKQKDDYIDDTEKNEKDYKDNEYDYGETDKIKAESTTRNERDFYKESENDYKEKPKHPPTTKASAQEYYHDAPDPPQQNENMFFHEANLANNNDSYEDYVTPKRDAVFESDSEMKTPRPVLTREKVKLSDPRSKLKKPTTKNHYDQHGPHLETNHDQYKVIGNMANNNKDAKYHKVKNQDNEEQDEMIPLAEDDDYYTEQKLEEVKAKTESLGIEPRQKGGTPKKLKGTMIPTRQHFKMSSPNYLAKIPVLAEKYDFNEPLPENDREPENLKHLPNPPAKINMKVKLR